MRGTLSERVIANSTQCGDCLLWKGAMASEGTVPSIWFAGASVNVRVALWKEMERKLGRGQTVKAKCGEDLCVAPEHLRASNYRSFPKSPAARLSTIKSMRARSHLNDSIIEDIRASEDQPAELARRYDVSLQTILDIQSYRRWAPLSSPFAAHLFGARA